MNRRDFFTRASVAVAGIAATCGLLPELASAQLPVIPVEPTTLHHLSPGTYESWNESVYDPMYQAGDPYGRPFMIDLQELEEERRAAFQAYVKEVGHFAARSGSLNPHYGYFPR